MCEEVWRAIGGILERQMRKCRGLVRCRGQGGVGPSWHRTDARMCERGVWCYPLSTPPSVLNLTCSLYHFPPRRVCTGGPSTCGNAACAAAISSIDDATLSLMKAGFTVSPCPAERAGGCAYALQTCVHESALGRAAGRAKRGFRWR
jgi:hypothetical protein